MAKAGSDNAIKAALLRGIDVMITTDAQSAVPGGVQRSIASMRPKYRQANGLVTMKPLVSDHPDDAGVELPFISNSTGVESWVKMLTAALLWSVTGKHDSGSDWNRASVFSPSYIPGNRDTDLTPEHLAAAYDRNLYTWRNLEDSGQWQHGWQPDSGPFPPEIYRFDVCLDTAARRPTAVIKHHFFCKHPYYVCFETSQEVISIMDRYLAAEADRLHAEGVVFSRALLPPLSYGKS